MPAARSLPTDVAFSAERWRRYRLTGDRQARDQLIMGYAPIVKYVAGAMAARMPRHVDIADLVSYGMNGLIDAVERYDTTQGTSFETYANMRVRGAIVDQLRSLDWVPRSVRDAAREIEDATAALTVRFQRMPTDGELAAELSLQPAELEAILQRVSDSRMAALDEPWGVRRAGGAEPTLMETLRDHRSVDPADGIDAQALRERIGSSIRRLSRREQTVLALRYQEDLAFGQIGEVLGVSESRVCQIHIKAALQLRVLMGAGGDRGRFERDA